MNKKETQSLKRLTEKLSALRRTLRNDERDLLDQLVLGAPAAEVEAHRMADQKVTAKTFAEPEVEAHRMADQNQKVTAKTFAEPEVEAHRFANEAEAIGSAAIQKRITFDPSSESYQVKD